MNVRRIQATKVVGLVILVIASLGLFHFPTGYSHDVNPVNSPLSAYREFYVDQQCLVDSDQLSSIEPGRIQFRLWTDFWHGRDCGPSAELNNSYLRIEVYDPRDVACETPIHTKETQRISLKRAANRDASDNRPIDVDLGPFLAHPDPYRVRIYLMYGDRSIPPVSSPLSKKNWSMNRQLSVLVR